jgi:hypothetical protein
MTLSLGIVAIVMALPVWFVIGGKVEDSEAGE